MIRTLLGLFLFYGRFGLSFSNLGYLWRKAAWQSPLPSMQGQRVMVTGASGGIGAATVAACVDAGAEVIAVARNPEKLQELVAANGPAVITHVCDLADTEAVRALAQEVTAHGSIDVLVNNVGVMLHEFTTNPDGMDAQFATNLLNQFVLTEALAANSGLADDACVIQVASGGMYMAPLVLGRLASTDDDSHDGTTAYAVQKRAQVVLTDYWNAHPHRDGITYHVMHPGWVDTAGVQQSLPLFRRLLGPVLRKPPAGADTIAWLAAEKPVARAATIWLDRARRGVHAYPFTRNSTTARQLIDRLQASLDASQGSSPDR